MSVYYENEFNVYGTGRDPVYFTSSFGEEDKSHKSFTLFLLCEHKIDYENLSFGYKNAAEMIKELQDKWGYALPQDFDYRKNFGYVEGYYCW